MKVLHYLPSIDRSLGGVGVYMQLLAQELGKLVELHIATHRAAYELTMENCTMHYIDTWKHPMVQKRQWTTLLDEIQPDVVHVNGCWIPSSALLQKWAQQRHFKVVLSPHGMLEPWIIRRHHWSRKVPAIILYQRSAVRHADMIHVTAESEKESLLKLGWNQKITIVSNGVNASVIQLKSHWTKNRKILYLSRIHQKKGLELLIKAIAKMEQDVQCIIAGEGDAAYIVSLQNLTRKLHVADKITFVGGVYGDEKWQLIRDADLFVLPTFSENFGIVVTEALASGTPVITTKGAPWAELETYRCGWWIDIGVEPLVRALNAYLSLSEMELEAFGRRGRALVEENYATSKIAEDMLKLYRNL